MVALVDGVRERAGIPKAGRDVLLSRIPLDTGKVLTADSRGRGISAQLHSKESHHTPPTTNGRAGQR